MMSGRSSKKFGFNKSERLNNKTDIGLLIHHGLFFGAYPINSKFFAIESEGPFLVQIMVSVPKRNFKRAVKRNLIKRRIREAYRLHKHLLYETVSFGNKKLLIAFNYSGKELCDFKEIENKIILTLQYIAKKNESKGHGNH